VFIRDLPFLSSSYAFFLPNIIIKTRLFTIILSSNYHFFLPVKTNKYLKYVYLIKYMESNGNRKRGRPRTKNGKAVSLFLSLDCISKLNELTTISRNKSRLVEVLINERFEKVKRGEQ